MDIYMTGIISGIITSLIVIVCGAIWKTIIMPWWENVVYKDATIEGVWESRLPELEIKENGQTVEYKERISLKRKGHRIYGEISCVSGVDEHKSYTFEGSFFNNIISATYSVKDRRLMDRGSFSLRLAENGKKFEGHCSYYYTPDNKIDTLPYTWVRVE